jgi:hypothetical protein
MGSWSLAVAGLTLLAALFEVAFGYATIGGDIGGFVAFLRAITIARVGFGIGAILGLVGLWRDEAKGWSIIGLVLNGGAEIGLAAAWGLWWYW